MTTLFLWPEAGDANEIASLLVSLRQRLRDRSRRERSLAGHPWMSSRSMAAMRKSAITFVSMCPSTFR